MTRGENVHQIHQAVTRRSASPPVGSENARSVCGACAQQSPASVGESAGIIGKAASRRAMDRLQPAMLGAKVCAPARHGEEWTVVAKRQGAQPASVQYRRHGNICRPCHGPPRA